MGAAMREAIFAANRGKLSLRQHRTFLAVLALTASYTKLQDRTYLAEVAKIAWGVREAEDWQIRKTSEDLRALDAAGVIEREAPRGRPNKSGPPRYGVAIPWPFVWVETHPDFGSLTNGKAPRNRSDKHPENGRNSTPESGTPPSSTPRSSPKADHRTLAPAARTPWVEEQINGVSEEEGLAHIRELRKVTERQKAKGAA